MSRVSALAWMGLCAACGSPGATTAGPGEVSLVTSVKCLPGLGEDAECVRLQVACAGLEDVKASVAVTEPDGPAKGTVFMHSGGSGTAPFDSGFVPELVGRGFRTVQFFWDEDWQVTDPSSIKAAACRPATALAWVYDEFHLADREAGFCAIGHSAGGGALSYALAHYGMGDRLDHVLLSAGPVFSRVDAGCDPVAAGYGQLRERSPRCAAFSEAEFAYSPFHAENVIRWSGDPTCGEPYDATADVEGLREQSILSDGAVLDYPSTRLDTWWRSDDIGGAAGQGTFFADVVESELQRHCADDCIGESSWTNPVEFREMVDTVAKECVPRH